MGRGGPTPSEVLFTAAVLPFSDIPEDVLAPGVLANPERAPKPPFRRFRITLALLPSALQIARQPDGFHTGKLSILAFVYDAEGNLILSSGREVSLNIGANTFQEFRTNPIRYTLDIDVPYKDESYLRIGIHDLLANHFGVIEVPVSLLPTHSSPSAETPGAIPKTPSKNTP